MIGYNTRSGRYLNNKLEQYLRLRHWSRCRSGRASTSRSIILRYACLLVPEVRRIGAFIIQLSPWRGKIGVMYFAWHVYSAGQKRAWFTGEDARVRNRAADEHAVNMLQAHVF